MIDLYGLSEGFQLKSGLILNFLNLWRIKLTRIMRVEMGLE